MTGLPSLKTVTIDAAHRQAARTDFSTMDSVQTTLTKWGFPLTTEPPAFAAPEVSAEHLTTDFNKDYTTMYAQQLAWLNYTAPLLAHVKGMLLELDNAIKDLETQMRKSLRGKNKSLDRTEKLSEKDIEDLLWLDPDHKRLTIEQQQFEQMRLRLQSHVESMENNMRVISRQVEIRKLEIDNSRTSNGMGYRGIRTPRT